MNGEDVDDIVLTIHRMEQLLKTIEMIVRWMATHSDAYRRTVNIVSSYKSCHPGDTIDLIPEFLKEKK